MNFLKDNKFLLGILIIGILIVGYFAYSSSAAPTILTQGQYIAKSDPDKISTYIDIQSKGADAKTAKDKNEELSDKVFIELIKAGVSEDRIKLLNYYVNPNYDWRTGKEDGFIANKQLVIESSDYKEISKIVSAAIDGGAVISRISFELSEEKQSELKAKALQEAGKDARNKADAIALGLGKKVGKLVEVQTNEFNYYPGVLYAKEAYDMASGSQEEARSAAINIAPTELEVRGNLVVKYALK